MARKGRADARLRDFETRGIVPKTYRLDGPPSGLVISCGPNSPPSFLYAMITRRVITGKLFLCAAPRSRHLSTCRRFPISSART